MYIKRRWELLKSSSSIVPRSKTGKVIPTKSCEEDLDENGELGVGKLS